MGRLDVCYKPARDSTKEMDERRKSAVENYDNTVSGLYLLYEYDLLNMYNSRMTRLCSERLDLA